MAIQQRIHTGCSCFMCRRGRTKWFRRTFHRMMRKFYKTQLQKQEDVLVVDKSIGYTD